MERRGFPGIEDPSSNLSSDRETIDFRSERLDRVDDGRVVDDSRRRGKSFLADQCQFIAEELATRT
jgi:hypothetical protein